MFVMMDCNVVLISIDSMRADHMGCYGYHRATSPHMDALAGEGALFTQAIMPHIPTSPSHTTLYTGLHVLAHKIARHVPKIKLDRRILMLPQILQRHGYATAAVDNLVTLGKGQASWFARGYDYYAGFTYQPARRFGERTQSELITKRSIEFFELLRGEPFFFFVHYWNPHTPYRPPAPYDRMFYDGDEYDPAHTSMQSVYALSKEFYRGFMADMGMADVTDLEYVIAQYDAEIRAVDEEIGRLMEALERLGLAERTLVILVSDHGEAFGEGALYFDHHGLHDVIVRIAMLMRLPGRIEAGRRIDAMVAGYDLVPTVLDAAGLDPPYGLPYELTGRSLWPMIDGHASDLHDVLLLSEATRQGSYGLRTPDWKLIVPVTRNTQGEPIPDLHGRPRDPVPLLFDLRSDPSEQSNVREFRPDVAQKLESCLAAYIREEVGRWGRPDPVVSQAPSAGFSEAWAKIQERAHRRHAPTPTGEADDLARVSLP